MVIAAFVLGVVTQGSKIATDTVVQTSVDDSFRGRVFSLYDVLFNVAFVGAAGGGGPDAPRGRQIGPGHRGCLGAVRGGRGDDGPTPSSGHSTGSAVREGRSLCRVKQRPSPFRRHVQPTSVPSKDDTLTVSGTLTNKGKEAISDAEVDLRVGPRLTGRGEVDDAAKRSTYVPGVDPATVGDTYTLEIPGLPGGSVRTSRSPSRSTSWASTTRASTSSASRSPAARSAPASRYSASSARSCPGSPKRATAGRS
ncbi:hypothetical protein SCALM49S_00963 [Streptomyces californicus]